jgi:hypothetical protein
MKLASIKAVLMGATMAIGLIGEERLQAETVIYLIDEDDQEEIEFFAQEGITPIQLQSETQLLEELDREPLNDRQQRIANELKRRQRNFILLLDQFMQIEFNPEDPGASPQFISIVQTITNMVFRAATETLYYDRLFLINQLWLDNREEFERFRVLDRAMTHRNLKLEERRKLIREIMVGGGSMLGAAGLGYMSFKASQKMLPIVTNEVSFGLVLKWLGRGGVIIVGAGVGASIGAYVGFLGSDMLLARSRDYLRAIDGDEDLRDMLDIIEELSGGKSWH